MRIKTFLGDRRGNVAVVFAASLVPLVGFSGFALDYARASKDRSALQSAADAAALAAVQAKVPTDVARQEVATRVFNANKPAALDVTPNVVATSKRAVVTASADVPTSLMRALQIDSMLVSARSAAVRIYNGPPPCVLALSKTGVGIEIGGSSSFTGRNCALHSNSSQTGAITISGSAQVKADGYCAVGTVSSTVALTPAGENYCDELPDPYASLPAPAQPSCQRNNFTVGRNDTITLEPCVYEGGLTVRGTATFKPGVYYIKNGPLALHSQTTVTGEGVIFYLTGTGAGFDINAGSTLRLSAPRSGTHAGILIMQDRNANIGASNTLNGNADAVLIGAIYMPTQNVLLNGTSEFGQGSPYMPIIANKVTLTGNNTTEVVIDPTNVPVVAPLPREASGARLAE